MADAEQLTKDFILQMKRVIASFVRSEHQRAVRDMLDQSGTRLR